MCGIAGVIGCEDCSGLNAMLDAMHHRGPDDRGLYRDDNVVIGSTRLSIIDEESGSQPIHNETEDVWTVLNGEIYNYLELRQHLASKNHTFYTDSDTEVIVHLYEEYGEGFVEHLNGMFAIALWDAKKHELLLFRDRLGIKPLYYAEKDSVFYFASEIQPLLQANVDRTVDSSAIDDYWELDYIPAPDTGFESISQLEPGSFLKISETQSKTKSYWEIPEINGGSQRDHAEELRELLEDAVRKRSRADCPIGVFLSGGIDSSALVGLLSQEMEQPVKTFSIAFEENRHDEREYSRLVADYYNTDHTEYVIDRDDAEAVEDAIKSFDQPLADPALIPTYILAGRASDEVKVIITGTGADELFVGYDKYVAQHRRWQRSLKTPSLVKRFAEATAEALPNHSILQRVVQRIPMTRSQEEAYLKSVADSDSSRIRDMISDAFNQDNTYLDNMTLFDLKYWLPDDLLAKVDRTTMANSVEARTPFLDHRVVRFARSVSNDLKVQGGVKKHILRKAVEDVLPDEILERDKHDFTNPVHEWITRPGPENPFAERFSEDRFRDVPGVDARKVVLAYAKKSRPKLLWKALTLQIWFEEHIA